MTTVSAEYRSGGPVSDPGCQLANTRHALVPVHDPEAQLWMVTETDCAGPFT